jgi:hypothetical protein
MRVRAVRVRAVSVRAGSESEGSESEGSESEGESRNVPPNARWLRCVEGRICLRNAAQIPFPHGVRATEREAHLLTSCFIVGVAGKEDLATSAQRTVMSTARCLIQDRVSGRSLRPQGGAMTYLHGSRECSRRQPLQRACRELKSSRRSSQATARWLPEIAHASFRLLSRPW